MGNYYAKVGDRTIGSIRDQHQDSDGFVYIKYAQMDVYGWSLLNRKFKIKDSLIISKVYYVIDIW